jgi:voltage-gated potassium channel
MVFTALVVIGGIGYIVLGVPVFFLPWLEKRIKNLIRPRLPELPDEDHVIVCGFSQTARAVINELKKDGHPFVVIADFKRLDRVPPEQPDFPLINGDAGESAVLEKARVKTASSAILLESDENNAFISLSCRRLNPDIHIVAAAWDTRNLLVLKKTRANKVISPKVMEGVMLGRKALKEHDIDISGELSITDMRLFQHIVAEDSPLMGKDIRSAMLGRFGIIIVGLWHEGELISTISPDTVLHTDDIIIMLATGEGMSLFTGYCGGAIA